jgi:hypothetical protein
LADLVKLMRPFILTLFGFLLLAPVATSTTYYVDFAGGSDTNGGVSTSTAWKRAPGMVGFSGNYIHRAGDRFIFKGGTAWDSTALPLTIANDGAAGKSDYYGVDISWYAGSSWTRPLFDAGYAKSDTIIVGGHSYISIDNLELAHVNSSSNFGYGLISGGAPSFLTISNTYLHGWRTSARTDDAHGGVIFTGLNSNVNTIVIDNCEIENSENSSRWNGVMFRFVGTIKNSVLHHNSSAVLFALDFDHNVMNNICYPQCSFDPSYHPNGVYLDPNALGKSVGYIRNSIFHDVSGGANMSYLNGRHATLYNYNNIYYGQISAQRAIEIDPYDYGANQSSGTYYILNNTGYILSGTPLVAIVDRGGRPQPTSIVLQNNHVIGASVSLDSGGPAASYTRSNNLIQTTSQATLQGYTSGNNWRPTGPNGGTVDAGIDCTSFFTADKDGISRPEGKGWDIGAYEFTSEMQTINAPTDLSFTVQ